MNLKFLKLPICLLVLWPGLSWGQIEVRGKVSTNAGEPVAFANVYLEEHYDGASTDDQGAFVFTTEVLGEAELVVSSVEFETSRFQVTLQEGENEFDLVVEKAAAELMEVVIAAGAFEAGNEKKGTLLSPLDIVQNPVAAGDLFGALQTLPGVSQVGDETGIFVRGGEAYETRTIIDGMIVQKPFFGEVPDIPARGRFDPFMFKGTLFSTGGYSAEYGQALSSVLLLNTQDIPDKSFTGVGLNFAGVNLTGARVSDKNSVLLGTLGYTNLAPYFSFQNQTRTWTEAPNGFEAGLAFKKKTQSGMFKTMAQLQSGRRGLELPNLDDATAPNNFASKTINGYWNTSYRGIVGEKWSLYGGVALSYDHDRGHFNQNGFGDRTGLLQARSTLGRDLTDNVYLRFGAETQWALFESHFNDLRGDYRSGYGAFYVEADSRLTKGLALRSGIRFEYEGGINRSGLGPRISLAQKTGRRSQVSIAYGRFQQTPEFDFLIRDRSLDFEASTHYILNYQWLADDYTFRIEAYHKEYDDLVKDDGAFGYNNLGSGYARGLELFWRDKKTIRNFDYWITYSFIDAERDYRDYPEAATPPFVTEHTLNLVSRYSLTGLRTRIGVGYTFASGRTYRDPNNDEFLSSRTKAYHNLNVNFSYLTTLFRNFTVVYLSFRNPLGFDQVFSYRFSTDGSVRSPVIPAMPRSVFAGLYVNFE